jgi:hypothetical protein
VHEYRIWTVAGPNRRPAIPQDRLRDVLEPRGHGFAKVDGPGDLRLMLGGCEMVFSAEDDGWHVRFEGDAASLFEEDSDLNPPGFLVHQVVHQIHEFTGGHIKYIRCD